MFQTSPLPHPSWIQALPGLEWIRLVSQDAHQVEATQNGIREIHVLREGPGTMELSHEILGIAMGPVGKGLMKVYCM